MYNIINIVFAYVIRNTKIRFNKSRRFQKIILGYMHICDVGQFNKLLKNQSFGKYFSGKSELIQIYI